LTDGQSGKGYREQLWHATGLISVKIFQEIVSDNYQKDGQKEKQDSRSNAAFFQVDVELTFEKRTLLILSALNFFMMLSPVYSSPNVLAKPIISDLDEALLLIL